MHDLSAPGTSKRLAEELQGLWNKPTTADCLRRSTAAGTNEEAEQLDTWEGEGGTSAPREGTSAGS
jgi:hypothetical protein